MTLACLFFPTCHSCVPPPDVRWLRVSGGTAGLYLRGSRRAERTLWPDSGSGGALCRAAWLVPGENHGPDTPTGITATGQATKTISKEK